MRRTLVTALACGCALLASPAPSLAADLEWEVENPFRFYKVGSAFALHEKAFAEVRGDPGGPLPADIVWRTERRLNDPDCKDPTTPATCAQTPRARYEESRSGWAAKAYAFACYDNTGRPRRYLSQCDRKYSWGAAKEDYILPDAHTVSIRLSQEHRAEAGSGGCAWSWQAHAGGRSGRRTQPCAEKFVIDRLPFSLSRAASGAAVKVQLPDGREFAEPDVTVEDLLVVGLGDSFASGDSNPDRPVMFSAARQMVYDPVNADAREEMVSRSIRPGEKKRQDDLSIASADDKFDPKSLPKRLLEDEERGLIYRPTSREFLEAFERRAAQWMSADCHRSQYGYQFRVGIELALENRHRSITLVHLACTGAEVAQGLFLEKDAREQFDKPNSAKVPAQLDQLADLLCRGGPAARSRSAAYALPMFSPGDTRIETRNVIMRWCPPEARRRPIDVVLLSIGGNDVGFSALLLYAMTENASDLAPIAQWIGRQIRFGPDVTRAYLRVLDRRIEAVKGALRDGFGVAPSQVVQTSYEPIQFDETGALCGTQPTLGLDVHPTLKYSRERLAEANAFMGELLNRLECISDIKRRADCPAGLATGKGTGFNLVTEHIAKFARRGVCARDPKRALADGAAMAMPRVSQRSGDFVPYSPASALPYAHRWRLVHTANDAFLTANTHREGISPFDILQPAYAGLYSGAMHPTAEGHAIVADSVLPHVRSIVNRKAEPPPAAEVSR